MVTEVRDWYIDAQGNTNRWLRPGSGPKGTAPTVPGAPTSLKGSMSGSGTSAVAVITYAPPAADGGSPITGYTVTKTDTPPATQTKLATDRSATFTGLTATTVYHFAVAAVNDVGPGPAVTVVVRESRFPGDTNPKTSGKWYTGIDEIYHFDPAKIEGLEKIAPEVLAGVNASGVPLYRCGMQRLYANTAAELTPPSGRYIVEARTQISKGRLPWMSLSIPTAYGTWARFVDSRAYAWLYDLIAYAEETLTAPFWFTPSHEPEADNKVSNVAGSGMQNFDYGNMLVYIRSVMDDYAAAKGTGADRAAKIASYRWKSFALGTCGVDFWGAPARLTGTQAWRCTANLLKYNSSGSLIDIPKRTLDFCGWDMYVGLGTTDITKLPALSYWSANWSGALGWTEGKGWPTALGEVGYRTQDTKAGSKLKAWCDRCMDGTHDVIGWAYYNTDLGGHQWLLDNTGNDGLADEYIRQMKLARSANFFDFGYTKPAGLA